ncbi:hypothetical protein ABE137_12020 [Brevibacillus laterosporus]|uniref:hypothetical protein n=1 Tax=Brevibacillus phage Sundance TaxID=1691958 RepID=UPI0006BC4F19|nr:hypothetical protein AVT09_gp072 [Brevibacillus phage Sundance]ALA47888.1 hypothetical protein SUNDANCE_72 [Brevibacillus phage Sundance]
MKGCVICNVKNRAFYVTTNEVYMCPKHRDMLLEEDEEQATQYKKNRFVIKGDEAEMSVYNKKFEEKPYKVIVDAEDIPLLQEVRWRQHGDGHVCTTVNKNGKKLSVNLIDFITYLRSGIESPLYHGNQRKIDCRKINIRVRKDRRTDKSTIKNLL